MLGHAPKGSITALNQHFACYKTCNKKSNPAFITVIGTMCLGLLINKSIHKILIIILLVSMFFAISDVHPGWQYVPEKFFFFLKTPCFQGSLKVFAETRIMFQTPSSMPVIVYNFCSFLEYFIASMPKPEGFLGNLSVKRGTVL